MTQDVFRVWLRPHGGTIELHERALLQYCKEKSIIGIGWGIPANAPQNIQSWSEYCSTFLSKGRNINGSCSRFQEMRRGDLAWIVGPGREYFLVEVRGDWTYNNSFLHQMFDIYQTRLVEWWKIDTATVPPFIANHSHLKTVERVRDEAAKATTIQLWRSL